MEFSLLLFSQQVIDSTARHSPGFQGEPEGGFGAWGGAGYLFHLYWA